MNRSLPLVSLAVTIVIGVVVAVGPVSSAHADLDSLLGDWADAAASADDASAADEVSLAPALATESLVSQAPSISPATAEDQFTPANWDTDASPTNSRELPQAGTSKEGDSDETLTGSVGHGYSSVASSHVPADLYQVATPTANPYFHSSHGAGGCDQCGSGSRSSHCDSGQCGGSGCGCSSCGQLVDRSHVHCIEGQSECRPHRRPNLPPPSTFLDLFRSRNSYTDVWAGYADETRLRVRNRSPHLDGTWRCRGCGALVEPQNDACGCGCAQ